MSELGQTEVIGAIPFHHVRVDNEGGETHLDSSLGSVETKLASHCLGSVTKLEIEATSEAYSLDF